MLPRDHTRTIDPDCKCIGRPSFKIGRNAGVRVKCDCSGGGIETRPPKSGGRDAVEQVGPGGG